MRKNEYEEKEASYLLAFINSVGNTKLSKNEKKKILVSASKLLKFIHRTKVDKIKWRKK